MSERNKILLALVVSVLLHLLGILGLMTWASLRSSARSTPPADLGPIVVTVTPLQKKPEPVVREMAQPSPTPMQIDSDGLAKADTTPVQPLFESDINSRAASRLPASGLAPLPSQEGKERLFPQFETKKFSLGPLGQPPEMEMPPATAEPQTASSQAHPEQKEEAKTAVAEPTPEPKIPKQAPTPIPSSSATEDTLAVNAAPTQTPTPEPSATPTESPSPDEIPRPTPYQPAMHSPKVPDLAMLSKPAPRRPRRPVYQPETEENRIQGSISNIGSKPGADVLSTPLGRYRKTIADAIGSRWYFYINQKIDLFTTGSVHIKFYIDELGHVQDIKILSNSGNGAFGDFSVQSISEAELPPLPPDLAPKLENGRLEVDYTFTLYPN